MKRQLFRQALVARGRPREVLEDERMAGGIVRDLEENGVTIRAIQTQLPVLLSASARTDSSTSLRR